MCSVLRRHGREPLAIHADDCAIGRIAVKRWISRHDLTGDDAANVFRNPAPVDHQRAISRLGELASGRVVESVYGRWRGRREQARQKGKRKESHRSIPPRGRTEKGGQHVASRPRRNIRPALVRALAGTASRKGSAAVGRSPSTESSWRQPRAFPSSGWSRTSRRIP